MSHDEISYDEVISDEVISDEVIGTHKTKYVNEVNREMSSALRQLLGITQKLNTVTVEVLLTIVCREDGSPHKFFDRISNVCFN